MYLLANFHLHSLGSKDETVTGLNTNFNPYPQHYAIHKNNLRSSDLHQINFFGITGQSMEIYARFQSIRELIHSLMVLSEKADCATASAYFRDSISSSGRRPLNSDH